MEDDEEIPLSTLAEDNPDALAALNVALGGKAHQGYSKENTVDPLMNARTATGTDGDMTMLTKADIEMVVTRDKERPGWMITASENDIDVGIYGGLVGIGGVIGANQPTVSKSVQSSNISNTPNPRGWPKASLSKAIQRHAGSKATTWRTKSGKIIWENPATGRQVVYDTKGKYFRIFQPNQIGGSRGTYLNMMGKEVRPAYKTSRGIKNINLRDKSKGAWQKETHYLNND